jgi:hypothetical protein
MQRQDCRSSGRKRGGTGTEQKNEDRYMKFFHPNLRQRVPHRGTGTAFTLRAGISRRT